MQVSYSKLQSYLICPYMYYQKYVLRVPSPDTEFNIFGSIIHETIARGYLKQSTLKEMCEYFATKWQEKVTTEDVIFYSDTGYVSKLKLGDEMITDYYNKVMKTSQPPVAIEYRFSGIPLGKHLLVGVIDLVDSEDKITDFKTQSTKHTKIEVALDYQLTFYSYAYRYIFNKIETGLSIYNLKHGLELTTTRNESHYKQLELVLDAMELSIEHELFYKRGLGKECKSCFDLEACQGLSRETFKRRN